MHMRTKDGGVASKGSVLKKAPNLITLAGVSELLVDFNLSRRLVWSRSVSLFVEKRRNAILAGRIAGFRLLGCFAVVSAWLP
jgi:hypothetical protein